MRRLLAALAALALVTLAGPVAAQKAAPPVPPACKGRDLLVEMQTSDPKSAAEVRAKAEETLNAKALLWKVEGKGGMAPSYLFGTVHITDARVHALPPPVRAALDGAKLVALELAEMSPAKMASAMMSVKNVTSLMMYTSGNGLTDHLTPVELKKVQDAVAKSGIPPHAAHLLRPWFVYASLAIPECETRRAAAGLAVLDQRIGEIGAKAGKPVVGLETVEEQLKSFAGLPEKTQVELLKVSLATLDQLEDQMETLTRLYVARDLGAIWPFGVVLAKKAGFDPALFGPFLRDVVERRNVNMRAAALPLIEKGGAFIAVGALHLPGKMGLVELLREAGYTVTAAE